MALLSGFPARGPLAACLNALRLYRTDSLGHDTPAIGTAFGTEANQPTSSLHNSAEGCVSAPRRSP